MHKYKYLWYNIDINILKRGIKNNGKFKFINNDDLRRDKYF